MDSIGMGLCMAAFGHQSSAIMYNYKNLLANCTYSIKKTVKKHLTILNTCEALYVPLAWEDNYSYICKCCLIFIFYQGIESYILHIRIYYFSCTVQPLLSSHPPDFDNWSLNRGWPLIEVQYKFGRNGSQCDFSDSTSSNMVVEKCAPT